MWHLPNLKNVLGNLMLMNKPYNLTLIIATLLLFVSMPICAKKPAKAEPLTYEIRCAGSGTQGHYLVEVSTCVDKANQISEDVVMRCAVHGVLFRGFTGGQGCTSQRPLTGSATQEQQHEDYYKSFFESRSYINYASFVSGSMKTARVGKQYKVTGAVSVAKDKLRRDLEKDGVIRGLSSGF